MEEEAPWQQSSQNRFSLIDVALLSCHQCADSMGNLILLPGIQVRASHLTIALTTMTSIQPFGTFPPNRLQNAVRN
ncbi:MAG: hypothetical protein ACERIG_02705, partial [Hyphomicrobium sp.]